MQGTNIDQRQKSPCSLMSFPVPEFIACVKCGNEIELWTDEFETICHECGYRVFKKETIIQ